MAKIFQEIITIKLDNTQAVVDLLEHLDKLHAEMVELSSEFDKSVPLTNIKSIQRSLKNALEKFQESLASSLVAD